MTQWSIDSLPGGRWIIKVTKDGLYNEEFFDNIDDALAFVESLGLTSQYKVDDII